MNRMIRWVIVPLGAIALALANEWAARGVQAAVRLPQPGRDRA